MKATGEAVIIEPACRSGKVSGKRKGASEKGLQYETYLFCDRPSLQRKSSGLMNGWFP